MKKRPFPRHPEHPEGTKSDKKVSAKKGEPSGYPWQTNMIYVIYANHRHIEWRNTYNKSTKPFQWNVGEGYQSLNPFRSTTEWALVTNEKKKKEKITSPLKNPAILRIRLVLDGPSLDMMSFRRESHRLPLAVRSGTFALPTALSPHWVWQELILICHEGFVDVWQGPHCSESTIFRKTRKQIFLSSFFFFQFFFFSRMAILRLYFQIILSYHHIIIDLVSMLHESILINAGRSRDHLLLEFFFFEETVFPKVSRPQVKHSSHYIIIGYYERLINEH